MIKRLLRCGSGDSSNLETATTTKNIEMTDVVIAVNDILTAKAETTIRFIPDMRVIKTRKADGYVLVKKGIKSS